MAISIIRERYADFGPTFACDKLRELHGLCLLKETVRHLMSNAGLWVPRKLRNSAIYQPRNRRNCVGELIQIDGSDHHWFEERAPACTLLVYIDDATSKLMHLYFTHSESTFSYFEATSAYIKQHEDEDLNLIFTFREPRKVSHALTLQYDTVLYMLADNMTTRKLIGRYIDVYEYPDGHIELHADGISLPYSRYDKLSEVNQGAIVENKRLGHVLQVAQVMKEQRDSRRGRSAPARTNQGAAPVRLKAIQGTKVQRQLDSGELAMAIQLTGLKN